MMSLWDALRMNMMISYQELVRTFHNSFTGVGVGIIFLFNIFPACSVFIREYDVFSFLNALLINDKQFFMIGMINSLSSIWINF